MGKPSETERPSEARPPLNVLIFHTDQQRYDSLGCCGNAHALTPNIDRLAGEGTNFHRHFSANPVCMPSRASLFSGRYCAGHGVTNNGIPLPRRDYQRQYRERYQDWELISHVPTMADVFAAAGYQTASVGKLHFTPTRASAGFGTEESVELWETGRLDDWHGPYYGFEYLDLSIGHGEETSGHYAQWLRENHPRIAAAVRTGEHRKNLEFPNARDLYPSVITEAAHHSTWVADRTIAYLREKRQADRPFFLFAGFPDPHHPYCPPLSLAREFSGRPTSPAHASADELSAKPQAMRRLMRQETFSAECITRVRQYTDAQIHLIDRSVGRVLAELEALNLVDDTIVIFTSDHGDYLGDHGMIRKSEFVSAALNHVPLIVRHPRISLPAASGLPVSNADVLPTLCQWTNIQPPPGVQGRSIAGALQETSGPPVLAAGYGLGPDALNFSLFDSRYRFTFYPSTGERELYDHEDDPYELRNRVGDVKFTKIEERLYLQLLEFHCRADAPAKGLINKW